MRGVEQAASRSTTDTSAVRRSTPRGGYRAGFTSIDRYAKRPLCRLEVLEEIVDVRHLGERGADLLDIAERELRLGFAVLDDAVDHASECLDEFRPGHLEG